MPYANDVWLRDYELDVIFSLNKMHEEESNNIIVNQFRRIDTIQRSPGGLLIYFSDSLGGNQFEKWPHDARLKTPVGELIGNEYVCVNLYTFDFASKSARVEVTYVGGALRAMAFSRKVVPFVKMGCSIFKVYERCVLGDVQSDINLKLVAENISDKEQKNYYRIIKEESDEEIEE